MMADGLTPAPANRASRSNPRADGSWETVGEVQDYPATTATDPAGLKGGERFTCELAKPVKVFALRVIGKPASRR